MELTYPASERPPVDPMETQFGAAFKRLLHLEANKIQQIIDDETKTVSFCSAAQLIVAVKADEPFDNQSADRILRITTGRDVKWWARWIREQL